MALMQPHHLDWHPIDPVLPPRGLLVGEEMVSSWSRLAVTVFAPQPPPVIVMGDDVEIISV
ncbi:hypothetical protein ED733_007835 [Metarhizium rileyi]|uniref:Uncharacterized protein n=1 Tax=Metarhizium rileyi (strain RCEF 4871) TaxID=1649241 RepID=A0A5C6GLW1_METRR|nr:hypothetical protein ED733_007835 [Metarhizium rileyi]